MNFNAVSGRVRARIVLRVLTLLGLLVAAACETRSAYVPASGQPGFDPGVTGGISIGPEPLPPPSQPGAASQTANVRVALLAPVSAGGEVGEQMVNAARLALADFPNAGIDLVVKDTKGTAAGAGAGAQEALDEGARLILGPLFASSVVAVSQVAGRRNIPVVAFSSDSRSAKPGVYLNSFAPEEDVRRTISYALSQGRSRIAALLPEGAYGDLVLRELKQILAASEGMLVHLGRYANTGPSMVAAARAAVLPLNEVDALYLPEGGKAPEILLQAITDAGGDLLGTQIIGSGQWKFQNFGNPLLEGAIFATNDHRTFEPFRNRYKRAYKAEPSIPAALVYDATTMAVELVRRNRFRPFSPADIQSPSGFSGVTGNFRFGYEGNSQRGLPVYQIQGGSLQIVEPAPAGFGGTG